MRGCFHDPYAEIVHGPPAATFRLFDVGQAYGAYPFTIRGPLTACGGLVDAAFSAGSLWPITFASGLFLLAAVPAFFILDRKQFITLLIVGVILAIAPIVLLRVLEHLVIPAAVIIGAAGLGALVFFLGRLWDRWNTSKRAKKIAADLRSNTTPTTLTDTEAAEAVETLATIRRPKSNG